MIDHLRVKSPWSQLAVFIGLLGCCMLVTMIFSSVILVLNGSGTPDWGNPAFVKTMKMLQAISSVTIFFIPAIVVALFATSRKPFAFLGLTPARQPQMYILAVLCMLPCFPVVSLLGEINQSISLPQWMVELEKDTSKQLAAFLKAETISDIIVNVIIMALLPAICEELCFRGALQNILINLTKNAWKGIIITAIIFSAIHFQFLGFLPRLFLGIILGAIYWYSGSLWPSILAHFVYNGVQVVAVSYQPEYIEKNPEVPIYYSLICAVIVLVIMRIIRSKSTVNTYGSSPRNI